MMRAKVRWLILACLLASPEVLAGTAQNNPPRTGGGGGGGTVTSITPGTGIAVTGTASVPIVTNIAPFGPDVSVQLNNASAGAVNAARLTTTLTNTAAGTEASDYTLKLLNAGAAFTSLYLAPTGFIGINTATTNSSALAAGSAGISIASTGNTTALMELRSGNTGTSLMNLAEINVWNGGTKAARLIWDNVSSTTGAQLTVSLQGTAALQITNVALVSNVATTINAAVTINASNLTVGGQFINMNAAANHFLNVTGGVLFIQNDANNINFRTNAGVTRLLITNAGSVVTSSAAIATNATDGFLYIPTSAGTPTGVPTTQTGTAALEYDTTNHKLYIYDGGWKGGTVPGAWN